jgi:WD40 repeat protein
MLKQYQDTEEEEVIKAPVNAPLLYACLYNTKQDLIFAGGAGKNQVRVFDAESGNIVSIISDIEKSVLTMDTAKNSNLFAFGCADSCMRIMDIVS